MCKTLKPVAQPPSSRYPLAAIALLALCGVMTFALVTGEKYILHAVPQAELVITPELAPPHTLAQEELFANLFNDKVQIYGAPPQKDAILLPTDFSPDTARLPIARAAITHILSPPPGPPPTSSPPPPVSPSPPPPRTPKPWLVEAMKAPRPLNASLVKPDMAPGRWAYSVQDVRPGTVLLANKSFGRERGYFDGAAVLLLKVCGCHPSIFGIILSPPSKEQMSSTFCPVAKARYPDFVNSSVRLGGPVGPHWTLLHSRHDVGAIEVSPGLFMGGSLAAYQRLVSDGKASAADLQFYSGYSAWPIDRLKQEVAAGQWTIAKASPTLVLEAAKYGGSSRDVISLALSGK